MIQKHSRLSTQDFALGCLRGFCFVGAMPKETRYNRPMNRLLRRILAYLIALVLLVSLSTSGVHLTSIAEKVNIIASGQAFDFVTWTVDAVWLKFTQSTLATPRYFRPTAQHQIVVDDMHLIEQIQNLQGQVDKIYADPSVSDPKMAAADLQAQLDDLTRQEEELAPFAESVLEQQVTQVLSEEGLTAGGQPVPWVLYHITPLPQNLVVSPRDKIEQIDSYLLQPNLTVPQAEALESRTDQQLNVSSLVVAVGGIATYPTMIEQTTALDWLSDTVAHEWTHLYLAQHPLGMNYGTSPELRTMNETTADIVGGEVGKIVMERYYPELAFPLQSGVQPVSLTVPSASPDSPPFDFRAEMHTTRVEVDKLLAEGKIDEAEAYMEQRRQVFVQHGYYIRKLNQAYFAFYGAYADVPGGAAGEDPVGPAVRALRAQSPSLRAFLERIAQMSSFAQLKQAVAQGQSK